MLEQQAKILDQQSQILHMLGSKVPGQSERPAG
jgi:hypothetical protein